MAQLKKQNVKSKKQPLKKSANPKVTQKTSILSDSVRLAKHRHTGKLLPHRHTSHGLLFLLVVIVGVFLYISTSIAGAETHSIDHSLTVVATVAGPPPTIGATILSPVEGDVIAKLTTTVSGTCQPDTVVIIYDNGLNVASVACSSASVFSVQVPLTVGANALQALNYDGLNQAGPSTPTVTVEVELPMTVTPPITTIGDGSQVQVTPSKPVSLPRGQLLNPFVLPIGTTSGSTSCAPIPATTAQATTQLSIQVTCAPRYLQPSQPCTLQLLVRGGVGPYAVSIDWADKEQANGLLSLTSSGQLISAMEYTQPGTYLLRISITDSKGNTSFTTLQVYVNGAAAGSPLATLRDDFFNKPWFATPVPAYVLIAVLTIGFWIGDIFNKHFGIRIKKPRIHPSF